MYGRMTDATVNYWHWPRKNACLNPQIPLSLYFSLCTSLRTTTTTTIIIITITYIYIHIFIRGLLGLTSRILRSSAWPRNLPALIDTRGRYSVYIALSCLLFFFILIYFIPLSFSFIRWSSSLHSHILQRYNIYLQTSIDREREKERELIRDEACKKCR